MRWRLISAFMVVTLLVVLVQDIPLGNYLVRVERDRLTTSLERDAFLLGGRTRQILEAGGGLPDDVAGAVRDYGRASGARVVIVDPAGTAVATSDDDQSSTGSSYISAPGYGKTTDAGTATDAESRTGLDAVVKFKAAARP